MPESQDAQALLKELLFLARHAPDGSRERIADIARALGRTVETRTSQLEAARTEAESLRARLGRLQAVSRESGEAFARHKRTFEKFRSAIVVCQRLKSLEDLPEVLRRLREILGVAEMGLVLSIEEFGPFAPEGADLRPVRDIDRELGRLRPEASPNRPFLGLVRELPAPEFFFGGDPLAFDQRVHAGSCFVGRLADKYRPERATGALAFFDPDPERYAPHKATHFLELFREALAGAVLDVKNHDRIVRESEVDELTGVRNRTSFHRHAPRLVKFAERKGFPLCLLFIDLDRFKAVNDVLGHEAGDRVLAAAAERIRDVTRKYDLFARLGGDEFVILSPDTDKAEAESLARRIRRELEALSLSECCGVETDMSVSASVGLAMHEPGMTPEELVRKADQSMYADKRGRTKKRPPPEKNARETA